jgi:predicted nuclease with RNAse H fold
VRVLGIDLAAQPEGTGVALLEVVGERPLLRAVRDRASDDLLVELVGTVDIVGVDAPLGWPVSFVAAVSAHERLEPWLGKVDRSELCFRRTDEYVRACTGRWPLSVSADKLGIVAMRCALLQERFTGEVWKGQRPPRNGAGRLVETYPAGALHVWGLPRAGYKGNQDGARAVRAVIVDHLQRLADLGDVAEAAIASDDTLDAAVCALVAWLAASGGTVTPDCDAERLAAVEGWIHLPSRRGGVGVGGAGRAAN